MTLEPALWEQLVQRGLTPEHLDMLLRLLLTQKTGNVMWYFMHGRVHHCEMKLTFGSRRAELTHVSEMLDGQAP